MERLIDSPIPIPSLFVVWNAWNSLSAALGSKPTPGREREVVLSYLFGLKQDYRAIVLGSPR
jgi:hypothetical protein